MRLIKPIRERATPKIMPGTTPAMSTLSVVSAATIALRGIEPIDACHDVKFNQAETCKDEHGGQRDLGEFGY